MLPVPHRTDRCPEANAGAGLGCCRVVFNDALRVRGEAYRAGVKSRTPRFSARSSRGEDDSGAWLAGRGAQCGVGAVGQRLPAGVARLFDSHTGKRKGRKLGRPRMKSRKNHRQSFRLTRNGFGCGQWAVVRGQGWRGPGPLVARAAQRAVEGHDHPRTRWPLLRQLRGRRRRDTAAAGGAGGRGGCWHNAVGDGGQQRPGPHRRGEPEAPGPQAAKVAAVGAGEVPPAEGSDNRDKTRRKVAIAHTQVARARRDYHHKQALALVRENQVIHVENLNIVGMVKNRRLARAVRDAGWGQFLRIIGEKADRYGAPFIRCRGGWRRARSARRAGMPRRTPATCTPVDLPDLPGGPRSRPQRRQNHSHRRAGGETKRHCVSPCKTATRCGGGR